MGKRGVWITPETWQRFDSLVAAGNTIKGSAIACGISENSGRNRIKAMRDAGHAIQVGVAVKPLPRDWGQMCPEAQRAWHDFAYFRERYMGHPSAPWAVEVGENIVRALESPNKEFKVINCPPGVGKTTLMHDMSAWITIRNRAIRGAFISKNSTNGGRMMMRLRRTLERLTPTHARDEEKKAGLGLDAVACLAADFGLFKPAVNADVWRSDQFVVVQADDTPIDEKEPTWSSYGMRSDVLSNRYDIIIGDDMDDNSTIRTIDASDLWHAKWDDEIENRLEPRGVCFIIQQRFGSNDLSGYNLTKKVPIDPEDLDEMTDEEQNAALTTQPTMYEHLKYKAHDETRCRGKETHRFDSPPWPDGCLLDPKRLPWREVNTLRNTKPRSFAIQYQQEDADPESVLVKKAWVYGGTDIDDLTGIRYEAPGCVDRERGLWEIPDGPGPTFIFASVDPSDRKNWACHVYAYKPDFFDQLFLLDAVRMKMTANQLLDYDAQGGHSGLMEEWQAKSARIFGNGTSGGISHWVVERTVSAQHLAHYQWAQLWERKWGTQIVEFQTSGANKWDEAMGVAMVKPWWKSGRIRLPFASGAPAMASLKLIEEVTRYPNAGTDDQVMAHWFAVNKLEEIAVRRITELPRAPRPGFVTRIGDARLMLAGAR